jgi:insulysin
MLVLAAVCKAEHASIVRTDDSNTRTISLGADSHMQIFPHHTGSKKQARPHSGKHLSIQRDTAEAAHSELPARPSEQVASRKLATSDVATVAKEATSQQTTAGSMSIMNKPPGDHRQYQFTKLDNGLDVVNVQDPNTKTCAFATAVTAGSLYDPPEHGGLAHLTEHALFLGTKKFPQESGFDEFVSAHGGGSNAYTDKEATIYYAGLSEQGFAEGLDRFADFFKEPLLNQTRLWNEVNAVVSEHSKNVLDPTWYCQSVMLSLANPRSPLHLFHTGDKSTLQNLGAENLTSELVSYFNRNYCPPRMKLVTFCSDDFKTQLQQAKQTFGKIPKNGITGMCSEAKQDFKAPDAFDESRMGKFVLVQGTTGFASLRILFPMDDQSAWTKSHPLSYISHMMSYGGENGLTSVLRDKLVLANSVSLSAEDSSAGTMVWMTISLTSEGAATPSAVLDTVFTYLAHVRTHGVTDEALDSFRKSVLLSWSWQNRANADDTASTMVEGMTRLKPTELLTTDSLLEEPNRTRVLDVLEKLRPERMNVGLVTMFAKDVCKKHKGCALQKLDHYGIEYNVQPLGEFAKDWKAWGAVSDADDARFTQSYALLAERLKAEGVSNRGTGLLAIELPHVVQDIPEQMSMDNAAAKTGTAQLSQLWGEGPSAMQNTKTQEFWYRPGWSFSPQPWVEASMMLRAPKAPAGQKPSARDYLKLQVGVQLLSDSMSKSLVDLGYRGTKFAVSPSTDAIHVSIGAYTPLVSKDSKSVLEVMNAGLGTPNSVILKHINLALEAHYSDTSNEPITAAFEDNRVLLTSDMFSRKELGDALASGGDITWKDAKDAVQATRDKSFYTTGVVLGNIDQKASKDLLSLLSEVKVGDHKPATADQVEKVTPLVMPKGTVELRKASPRKGDTNHVTIMTIFAGPATVEKRVLLGILGPILSNVAYTELRTKKGLGYTTGGGISETSSILKASCFVQGAIEASRPDTVEADCEQVLSVKVPEEISKMDDKTFQAHKESFKSSLLSGPLATSEELGHFENPILLGGCYHMRESMLAFLETVTSKDQLMAAWNEVVQPMNGNKVAPRKKLLVKYFSDAQPVPAVDEKAIMANYQGKGLSESIIARVLLERQNTHVVHEATSTVRESLIKEGGYFPTDLHCEWTPPGAAGTPPTAASSLPTTVSGPATNILKQQSVIDTDRQMPSLIESGPKRLHMRSEPYVRNARSADQGSSEHRHRYPHDHHHHARRAVRHSILQTVAARPTSLLEDFHDYMQNGKKGWSWSPHALRQPLWTNKVLKSEILPYPF